MATDKQIEANRENAKLSTGASSPAGKEAVSQNATKHGLTGSFVFRSDKDHQRFVEKYKSLVDDHNAQTIAELELVERMTESLWRSRIALDLQDECIDILAIEIDEAVIGQTSKKLELYMRYQSNHDRAYQRYAGELRKLQSETKKAEIGFVSQEQKTELVKARIEHQHLKNRKVATEVFAAEQSTTPGTEPRPQASAAFQAQTKAA